MSQKKTLAIQQNQENNTLTKWQIETQKRNRRSRAEEFNEWNG